MTNPAPGFFRIQFTCGSANVAQTSESAVSRISNLPMLDQSAGAKCFGIRSVAHSWNLAKRSWQPTGKSAIQQVRKPALRRIHGRRYLRQALRVQMNRNATEQDYR